MKRSIGIIIGLLVVVAALWLWPFVGAAELADAARRGDSAAVMARVDLPALRRSLARQIAVAYLRATGKADKLGNFGRSLAGAAATTVADPYVADLLTPENVTALVGRGTVGTVKLGDREVTVGRQLPGFADMVQGDWLGVLTSSYYDGVPSFAIPVAAPEGGDYTVHLRLDGITWKLAGLDLPPAVVDEVARQILAQSGDKPAP